MSKRPMYFKTNMIFHNSYLCKLESCINSNNDLSKDQKNELSLPLYKFYEFSIRERSKENPESTIGLHLQILKGGQMDWVFNFEYLEQIEIVGFLDEEYEKYNP